MADPATRRYGNSHTLGSRCDEKRGREVMTDDGEVRYESIFRATLARPPVGGEPVPAS